MSNPLETDYEFEIVEEDEGTLRGYTTVDGERVKYEHTGRVGERESYLQTLKCFDPDSKPDGWIKVESGDQVGEYSINPHKRPNPDKTSEDCPVCGGPTSISGQPCDGCR